MGRYSKLLFAFLFALLLSNTNSFAAVTEFNSLDASALTALSDYKHVQHCLPPVGEGDMTAFCFIQDEETFYFKESSFNQMAQAAGLPFAKTEILSDEEYDLRVKEQVEVTLVYNESDDKRVREPGRCAAGVAGGAIGGGIAGARVAAGLGPVVAVASGIAGAIGGGLTAYSNTRACDPAAPKKPGRRDRDYFGPGPGDR